MANKPAVVSLSSDDFTASDTAEMCVVLNGRPTDWSWTFAGPGHPVTIAQGDRLARESLHARKQQEQARVNGKKWTAPDESLEDLKKRTVDFVLERMIDWSAVEIDGKAFPFSRENARELLSKPANRVLLDQAYDFLGETANFMRR
jgi:hypothetical protein